MDALIMDTLDRRVAKIPLIPKGRAAIAFTLRMRYKKKLLLLFSLLMIAAIVEFVVPGSSIMTAGYSSYIFRPWQSLRHFLFGAIPLSVGDLLYMLGALSIIAVIIRWSYFVIRFKSHKHYLGQSFLNTAIALAVIYIMFFAGYGGNYYKPSLAKQWGITVQKGEDSAALLAYDRFLINRLNALAPEYSPLSFKAVNERAQDYYQTFTNNKTRMHGLGSKPSVFGYFMQYLGIQGYYNPFTGEAQVNRFLPSFMLPFVVCHEMAHQSGIAAEDDANLLSYALCTRSADKNFTYSGYFNLWLYTHTRLRRVDTTLANELLATLNPLSKGQVDTLRAIRRKYRSEVSTYSAEIYDSYLRLHNQKDGIESYNKVVLNAWQWEQKKAKIAQVIDIP